MTARRATSLALPALALILGASPATAQDVRADVRIRTGPVAGRVVIDTDRDRPRESHRVIIVDRDRHRDGRVVVERRSPRRVTIVEDFRGGSQRAHARHDNRHVVAFWDPRRDEYGFRPWRSGLRRVLLCEHGDKYYVLSGPYADRHDRDDRDDGRWDDRRDHRGNDRDDRRGRN